MSKVTTRFNLNGLFAMLMLMVATLSGEYEYFNVAIVWAILAVGWEIRVKE